MQRQPRHDAEGGTSGCSWRYIATKRGMRGGCAGFLTRMHVIQDNYCILPIFFVSLHCVRRRLHCHSSRTANGKLTTKKTERENDRGAHLPYLFLNVEPLKKKGKRNEKGSLENYLADAHRSTHRHRHYPRRYQLHVD